MPYQKVYDDLFKANQEFRNTSRTKLARSLKQRNDSPRSGTHRVVLNKYLEKTRMEVDSDYVCRTRLQSSFKERRTSHGYTHCILLKAFNSRY